MIQYTMVAMVARGTLLTQYLVYMVCTPSGHGITTTYLVSFNFGNIARDPLTQHTKCYISEL